MRQSMCWLQLDATMKALKTLYRNYLTKLVKAQKEFKFVYQLSLSLCLMLKTKEPKFYINLTPTTSHLNPHNQHWREFKHYMYEEHYMFTILCEV